jgi:hypothetical protein
MRLAGHVVYREDKRGTYSVLVARPEENRPFGRRRRGLDYNIKMDLKEVDGEGMVWLNLA